MEHLKNTGIKDVIKKYPAVGEILNEYNIDCPNCKGNCLLKNVVEAENLSMDEEIEVMGKLSDAVREQ